MVHAGNYNGDLAFTRSRGTLQSGLPQETHKHTNTQTHKCEPAQTIEDHQNTVRVISLRVSLHAHAHLTLQSYVYLLVVASKQEITSEDT